MKNILVILFIALSIVAFGQELKIKWEDQAGREFSITAPSGEFSYGMIAGDRISYDVLYGRVIKVGPVRISYDVLYGRVIKVGPVRISYDLLYGRVIKVGGLFVHYDLLYGRVTGTSGSVN